MKKWIRLFHLSNREWIEEELNKFISQHEGCEIYVWNDQNGWYAQVRYSYPTSPSYLKPESEEESSASSEA